METMAAADSRSRASAAANGGKYLTFLLGREEYGLPVLKVREIIKVMDITHVPQVPAHVLGVINLRGKVIPVIDLRRKFGFADAGQHRAHLHHRRRGRSQGVDGDDGRRGRRRVGSA